MSAVRGHSLSWPGVLLVNQHYLVAFLILDHPSQGDGKAGLSCMFMYVRGGDGDRRRELSGGWTQDGCMTLVF